MRAPASKIFRSEFIKMNINETEFINKLENALFISKILSYVQGFQLLKAGSKQYSWNLSLRTIAAIWRNGCIIRSAFLDEIKNAYEDNHTIESFMFTEYFQEKINDNIEDLREITAFAISHGIPVPGLSATISYFDSITSKNLPTNLIQAQRDYFGAHGYRRIDTGDKTHHTDWKSN